MAITTPKNLADARALCDRFAELDGQIAAEEVLRNTAIAEANAAADKILEPLMAKRGELEAAIEPWFTANKDELLEGKRKSFELGGCVLGTRKGKAKLGVSGDKDTLASELDKARWAKDFVKTKVSLDVPAISKGLIGRHGDKLREKGFSIIPGVDSFHIGRTEQAGTQSKIG